MSRSMSQLCHPQSLTLDRDALTSISPGRTPERIAVITYWHTLNLLLFNQVISVIPLSTAALPFLFLCLELWIHFSPLFIPLGPETFSIVSLLSTSFSRLFQDKGWPGYNPALRSTQPQASFPNEVKRSAAAKKNTASQLLPRAVNILIRIISKPWSHGKP